MRPSGTCASCGSDCCHLLGPRCPGSLDDLGSTVLHDPLSPPWLCLVPLCSLPQGPSVSGKYHLPWPVWASGSPELRARLEQLSSPQVPTAPSQVGPGQELTRAWSAFTNGAALGRPASCGVGASSPGCSEPGVGQGQAEALAEESGDQLSSALPPSCCVTPEHQPVWAFSPVRWMGKGLSWSSPLIF